jgi:serine carboxypeptidase-like clade 2
MIKTLTKFDATGHYVPQLAEVVYEHNKHLEANQQIHLKGFMVSVQLKKNSISSF